MPHRIDSTHHYIQVTPLAPTFAAEVEGVDFSYPVPPDVFQEIHNAITQVSGSKCSCDVTEPQLIHRPSTAYLFFDKQVWMTPDT